MDRQPGQIAAEYRDVRSESLARVHVLDRHRRMVGRRERVYELTHRVEGWVAAGPVARWAAECYQVRSLMDGTTHSQSFRTLDEARSLFDRWTC